MNAKPSDQPEAAPRRQQRGIRRIESILDAAEEVIARCGYDGATTNQIAAEAGISPGSLYQYFTSKSDVVEALAHRYLKEYAETRRAASPPTMTSSSVGEVVDQVVDPLVEFNLAHPAAKYLLAGAELSTTLAASTRDLHVVLLDQVEELMAELAPARPPADRQLSATLSIQILAAALPAILRASPVGRARLIRELKIALGGYWSTIAAAA